VGVTEIPAAVGEKLARLRAENARLMRLLKLSAREAAPRSRTMATASIRNGALKLI